MRTTRSHSTRTILVLLASLLVSTSCRTNRPVTRNEISASSGTGRCDTWNTLLFVSPSVQVDLMRVSGVDLGMMYSPDSYTPRYVGRKGYITYDGITVDDTISVVWKYSKGADAAAKTNTFTRSRHLASALPKNMTLILNFDGTDWSLSTGPHR